MNMGDRAMGEHLDLVLSRLANMLKRITAKDGEFGDLCVKHAEVTAEIRKLDAADANHAERDEQLRRRRAAMEDQMFAIMQANTRI
jgi:uncharacterized protein YdcH (DUF465 family)